MVNTIIIPALGDWLRHTVKSLGVSQSELCRAARMSKSTLQSIYSGK